MPLYEFCCSKCFKKFTVLCSIADRDNPQACQHCGETNCRRLVSRVKKVRTEEQIMESLADPSALSGLDENDPRTFATWAKKMAREMGENMDEEIESMAQEEFSGGDGGMDAPSQALSGGDDDQ
ncbi:MAG: zinc ribbon domain-containing protein [Candidatus Riflebacteria bacterium]|nr:zinc ribbon domain-containing protein [Candidatus Riflebacteria bacterium]